MVSANQINGVENMYDRPDSNYPKKVTDSSHLSKEDVKKFNSLADQISSVENGKVIPR